MKINSFMIPLPFLEQLTILYPTPQQGHCFQHRRHSFQVQSYFFHLNRIRFFSNPKNAKKEGSFHQTNHSLLESGELYLGQLVVMVLLRFSQGLLGVFEPLLESLSDDIKTKHSILKVQKTILFKSGFGI